MCASEFLLCIHLCTTKSKGYRVDSSIILEFFFPRALILTFNQRNQGNGSNRFLDSFLCILRGVFPECGLRGFKSYFKAFITEFSVVCFFNLLSEIFICKHWGFLFLISPVSFSLLLCLSIPIWRQVNKGERESVTFSRSHHYWCVLSAKWSPPPGSAVSISIQWCLVTPPPRQQCLMVIFLFVKCNHSPAEPFYGRPPRFE